ncbi:MAG: tetratricopeptide repeat protein [Chloroflexia bacterium]
MALHIATDLLPDFRDGVYFVDLAPIKDASLVIPTIAQTLGVQGSEGKTLVDTLKQSLMDKKTLLVLDNFEQVVDAAPQLSSLLAGTRYLRVLITSRTLLRLAGEHEFVVPPLELPDLKRLPKLELLRKYEAVALFVERAQAVKPYFDLTNENGPAVAEICVRLDGLPLAIELAAARIKLLTPQALLERLGSRLQLLTSGMRDLPARQQTLRSTIDWSYDILEVGEQTLFRRLAVFRGGCTLQTAEAILAGSNQADVQVALPDRPLPPLEELSSLGMDPLDGLGSLVEKSLIRQESSLENGGESRFTLLQTIHEYASERLAASNEEVTLRRRHATYFLSMAEKAEAMLYGPERGVWLVQLEEEHDNMRGALDWLCSSSQDDPELRLRLAGALGMFWQVRGYITEGREQLARVTDKATAPEPTAPRAKALLIAGRLATVQCDFPAAREHYEESLALWRELGNKRGVAASLDGLANVAAEEGDYSAARAYYEENLTAWREANDQVGINSSLNNLAIIATREGDYEKAAELLGESLIKLRELGDRQRTAQALNNLGNVQFAQGDYAQAWPLFEESAALERELGNKQGLARSLGNMGKSALRLGDYSHARRLLEESLNLRVELGDRIGISKCLAGLAEVNRAEGNAELAARLLGASDALLTTTSSNLDPSDRSEHERYVTTTREQLDKEAFTSAWDRGRALTLEQAVATALEG